MVAQVPQEGMTKDMPLKCTIRKEVTLFKNLSLT